MSVRISICCCNLLFSEGLERILEEDAFLKEHMINFVEPEKINKEIPDLLILDFMTLSMLPFDTLLNHQVKFLLLWTGCLPKFTDERLFEFISKGLIGVLSPKANASQFKKALRSIITGELWFSHKQLKEIILNIKNTQQISPPVLTKKEMMVVKTICMGYRNKDIMKHLKMNEQSVKKCLNRIYKKVGVTDRLQLALYAMKHWSCHLHGT